MKLRLLLAVALISGAAYARGPRFYEKGTLLKMDSVECGVDTKGAEGIGGILGVNDSQHTKSRQMLCPEYVLRAEKVDYKIRPKEEKHPFLLPVGEQAEFRINKDRMHILVPELDGHEREYIVVSVTPREEAANAKNDKGAAIAQK